MRVNTFLQNFVLDRFGYLLQSGIARYYGLSTSNTLTIVKLFSIRVKPPYSSNNLASALP